MKIFIKSLLLSTIPLIIILPCVYFIFFIHIKNDSSNLADWLSAITSIFSLQTVVFGILSLKYWKKEKFRAEIFNTSLDFHKCLCTYLFFIYTTTNIVRATIHNNDLKSKNLTEHDKSILYSESNVILITTLHNQITDRISEISKYYLIRDYISPEFRASISYLTKIFPLFCRGMKCPVMNLNENNDIRDICKHIKSPLFSHHINRVTSAKIEDIYVFTKL